MAKRIVYSTDQGKMCPDCGEPQDACRCATLETAGATDGIVRLHRQTKGRNGKPVTLITGLGLTSSELKKMAKQLKQQCGVGGSVEGYDILIQGDKRELIKSILESQEFTVKMAGG